MELALRTRVRSLVVALAVALALALGIPGLASASHIKGGAISAQIDANGILTGTVTSVEANAQGCPHPGSGLFLGGPSVTGPGGYSANAPVGTVSVATCTPSAISAQASFTLDLSGQPDGIYELQFAATAWVAGIQNSGSPGAYVTARVLKEAGVVHAAPRITNVPSLGLSRDDGYAQRLAVATDGNVPATFARLQSGDPADTATYKAQAPTSNIVSLSADGTVSVPPATSQGLTDGHFYVYHVRVGDTYGQSVERSLLLTVTNNRAPVFSAGSPSGTVSIPAGTTTQVGFQAEDPDQGQTLTAIVSGLPAYGNAVVDGGTATVTLNPAGADVGDAFDVAVDVTDDGAVGLTASRTVRVNVVAAVPPAVGVTGAPAPLSSDARPSITFGVEPADAQAFCSFDGGAPLPCTSPWTPDADLADGDHELVVTATRFGAGSAPRVVRWRTDRTPPAAPALVSGPEATTTSPNATIAFSGEPGATFACAVDGGAATPCASPLALTGRGLGAHTVSIVQTDAAGNAGPPLTAAWTVVATQEQPVPPVADGADLSIAPRLALSGRRLSVGCSIEGGAVIDTCVVDAFADVPRARATRLVKIGTGRAKPRGDRARVAVDVRLNALGRRLVNRPGGVRVTLRMRVTPKGSGTVLRADSRSRLLPERILAVPSDGMFASGSATIADRGRRFVRGLGKRLAGARTIVCTGHTDALGPRAYNRALGRARARAVCKALRGAGLRKGVRLIVRSAGETRPRAANTTAAGRALNRRVALTIAYKRG